ncbi:hypothetical protein NHH03_01435 [Stieleria sp. TO1_6]|uniref:hypothetical protein n=1 Tax=Stieleria tagensis TaxID=2956795 RepID=UPI00209AD395|nr:hypothetical protein [Stieleria tagensis]MCO8120381.1 hypothetical protein [Stieleria tagensis]
MKTDVTSELCQTFKDWQADDRRLDSCLESIREWMLSVQLQDRQQPKSAAFAETAERLAKLRDQILRHFAHENEMLRQLVHLYSPASPEVMAFKRQTDADHRCLLDRLEDLYRKLVGSDRPFETWSSMMDEIDIYFESLGVHQRQEADRVSMLIPIRRSDPAPSPLTERLDDDC